MLLYRDVLFGAAENRDSSQRIRHHFPVLGAWLVPDSWLSLVPSDGSPTLLGLLVFSAILFRAARPRPSAGSADLFAGVAARMGVGSAMAGPGATGAAGAAGGGVGSTADVSEAEGRTASRTTGRHNTQTAASASSATTVAAKTTTRLRRMIGRALAVVGTASGTQLAAGGVVRVGIACQGVR
jgi:hypothetical protein